MKAGDDLGADGLVVGYECDGCELAFKDNRMVPTFADDTPEGFEILATADAPVYGKRKKHLAELADNYIGELNWVATRIGGADTPGVRERFANGHAVLGTFKRGQGEVFTTGCTDWAYGLRDSDVAKVTNNVLEHFIKGS